MKVAIIDIKPNTLKYDVCLIKAMGEKVRDNIQISFLTSDINTGISNCKIEKLVRLFRKPVVKTNIILKGINWLVNYFQILYLSYKNKYEIIHFEWLVFLQKSPLELFFFRLLFKRSRIILTVHNIYPHSIDVSRNSNKAIAYKERFRRLDKFVSRYIVHTDASVRELSNEFGISHDKISVCVHGLFLPEVQQVKTGKDNRSELYNILMFGVQSPYKGTDILIDAISLIPNDIRKNITVTIAGISTDYRDSSWPNIASGLGIRWIDKLLDESELNDLLDSSNLIVFPYRVISQSGALLLALSYGKPIVVSDLPSFKETLSGFPDSIFFKNGDAQELSKRIVDFVNGSVDTMPVLKRIVDKQKELSWEVAANQTIETYKKSLNITS